MSSNHPWDQSTLSNMGETTTLRSEYSGSRQLTPRDEEINDHHGPRHDDHEEHHQDPESQPLHNEKPAQQDRSLADDSELELAPVKTRQYLSDLSHGIVGWESPDDPENPMNFTKGKKWLLIGLMSLMTFVSPLASSMFSPAMEIVAVDFQETNKELLSFTVSVFLLGYAVSL